MINLNNLQTEQRNIKTLNLDKLSTRDIIEIMCNEDLNVVAAIKKGLPEIEMVITQAISTLNNKGN